jgi:hypothetical protein
MIPGSNPGDRTTITSSSAARSYFSLLLAKQKYLVRQVSLMKCKDCGQDILQAHPQMCPYCRSKNLIDDEDASKETSEIEQLAKKGRYEEAALRYEKLDLWDKAKECRRLAAKKNAGSSDLETGKVGTITVLCPHCGAAQPVTSKSDKGTCSRCGTIYRIPSVVHELVVFDEKR